MKIKAAVTYEKDAPFVIKDVELAEPRENDVLVKMVACGVCHTDAAVVSRDMDPPLPIVLGHEGSGIVEKVGSAVKTIKPGDHVVMTQNFCGVCESCATGHPMSCVHVPDYNFNGVYPDGDTRLVDTDGTPLHAFFSQSSFATYAIADVHNTIVIDKDFDLGLAAPLGCGVQTGAGAVINVLNPQAGSTIAVFGCGGVGLSAVMAAKVSGCSEIIAIDAVPGRLALAEELGATCLINGKDVPDIADEIVRLTGGRGVDYSLECSGVAMLVDHAFRCLAKRGTAGLVGSLGHQDVVSKMMFSIVKDCHKVVGILEGDSVPQLFIPKLIDLHKKGLFPFDKMIEFYDFNQIDQAFDDSHKGIVVKPVIRF